MADIDTHNYEWSDTDEEELARLSDEIVEASKYSMKCDTLLKEMGTPLERYRPNYLMISDFVKQYWCEQQLLYSLSPEVYLMNAVPGDTVSIEESAAVKEVKRKGSHIHLERELEIQVPVVIRVKTREDAWAVKFLNIQTMIQSFNQGDCVAREIPVFGMPFGKGIFLYGIVDELQYNPDLHTVEILELKTRQQSFPPKKSQQDKDKYQVSLYAQLFNELVQGKVTREMVATHFRLKLDALLSDDVLTNIHNLCTMTDIKAYTLGNVLDTVLCQMQSFTCISKGTVEYVHQDSKKQISTAQISLDPERLKLEFARQCEWWLGERGTQGVDIEDCWKCNFCPFAPMCEWRSVKAGETGTHARN